MKMNSEQLYTLNIHQIADECRLIAISEHQMLKLVYKNSKSYSPNGKLFASTICMSILKVFFFDTYITIISQVMLQLKQKQTKTSFQFFS